MIDRVARAIGEAYDGLADPELTPDNWARAVEAARSAIEAMREPTEAMKDAYYKFDERFSSYPAQDCWETMLDEALK
jgi:hypothetical protein